MSVYEKILCERLEEQRDQAVAETERLRLQVRRLETELQKLQADTESLREELRILRSRL